MLAFSRTGADTRDPSRPVLVLLHPIGLDRTCWDGVIAALGPGYEIVAVDLAGHGGSADRTASREMADDADAVAELIRHLGIGPVIIVGVSFGGMIAQTLALRHPELVAALVPCACPPRISPENRAAMAARGDAALSGGMDAIVPETIARWFTGDAVDGPEAAKTADRLRADTPSNWANAWLTISRFDVLDRLKEIKVPTLCIAGEKDVATPMAAMEALAGAVPGARLLVMDGAPHMLHVQMPVKFAEILESFTKQAGVAR